jgi:hypothetical protein
VLNFPKHLKLWAKQAAVTSRKLNDTRQNALCQLSHGQSQNGNIRHSSYGMSTLASNPKKFQTGHFSKGDRYISPHGAGR